MANQLVTPTWVMKEVTRLLVNNLKFSATVNRDYSSEFVQGGAKVGLTVNARLPQRYQVSKGQAINIQPVTDNIVPISITDQANVGLEFSMESLKMQVDNYRRRYVTPAVEALANTCDFDGISRMYQQTFRTVGTPQVVPGSSGTLPQAANAVYLAAGTRLDDGAVPESPRIAMLNSTMHATLVNANMTLFNPSAKLSEQYRTGQFANDALGISEWYKTQNIPTHTVGPLGGAPQADYAAAPAVSGTSTINVKGFTAAIGPRLNKGDVIQVAGVLDINPMSYQPVSVTLMDFVVAADTASDAAGKCAVPVSPPLYGPASGAMQNISAMPADNAVITVFNDPAAHANKKTPTGLVYHPDAYAMVMVDLELPQGLWVAERISSRALAISVRFLKDYTIMTDQSPARLDIMYGWKAVRPEMAVRVQS